MNDDRLLSPDGATGGPPAGLPDPPPDPHAAPRGARTMNHVRLILLIVLGILAVLSIGSYVLSRTGAGSKTAAAAATYHCPMHPTYTSDRPGECPICGMDLEPIEAAGTASQGSEGDVPGLVGVHIEADRVQRIGVRTAVVEKRPLGASLDLVAFVAPDESRMKRVQLRVAGWVKDLNVSRTGEVVRAGQPLLSLYSPELFQSEREFLIELEGAAVLSGTDQGAHHEAGALASARQRLALLGVPAEEIARLERERKAETRLTLRAPVTGTVLERGVTEGQYVGPNTTLLTLADLSRIWLLVDLYQMDLPRVRVGDRAVFTADGLPGKSFEGRVEFIYPTVSTETRTVKARIALPNPAGDLRPGMFGQVKLATRGAALLTVPTEAIIHTGEHDYVFISHESGHFEPRMVWVGRSDGDLTEVRKGLTAGETVVASASFLIDSESRLRAAISGAGGASAGGHQH